MEVNSLTENGGNLHWFRWRPSRLQKGATPGLIHHFQRNSLWKKGHVTGFNIRSICSPCRNIWKICHESDRNALVLRASGKCSLELYSATELCGLWQGIVVYPGSRFCGYDTRQCDYVEDLCESFEILQDVFGSYRDKYGG